MKTIQKQQLIKFLGITLICLFCRTAGVFGQSYDQALLINKEWANRTPGKPHFSSYFFTDTELTARFYLAEKEHADGEIKQAYYLSDEIPDVFQHDLVGKNTSGRYIVVFVIPKIGEPHLNIHEIVELSDTALKLKHIRSETVSEYSIRES
jgi:hypothetical protein